MIFTLYPLKIEKLYTLLRILGHYITYIVRTLIV